MIDFLYSFSWYIIPFGVVTALAIVIVVLVRDLILWIQGKI